MVDANWPDSFGFLDDCLVSVDLSQQENHVWVELTQSEIPTDEKGMLDLYIGCATGWTFYLATQSRFWKVAWR